MMPKLPLNSLILFVLVGSVTYALPPLEKDAVQEASESYREGNWLAALEKFQIAANRASEPAAKASANFFAGECSLQLGRYAAAKEAYQRVLNSSAGEDYQSRATFRVAEIARLSGATADAESLLRRFLSDYPHDPSAPSAYYLLGEIAVEAGQEDKAIVLYQAAINHESQGPSALQARLGLARVMLAGGKASQVVTLIGTLTQCDDAAIRMQAMLLLGRAEYDSQQYDQALNTFRQAYRNQASISDVTRARLAAGWSLWKLARYEEVAAEIGKAPTDSQLASEYHYLMGIVAYSRKNWTSAIREFTESLSEVTSSLHSATLFYLGESCLKNEQYSLAKKWLTRLITEHGESEWADDAVWTLIQIARETGQRSDFEQASTLLRTHYPASDYLRILEVAPWGNAPLDHSLTAEKPGTEVFEEAVGLERDGYFGAALAAYSDFISSSEAKPLQAEAIWRSAHLHDRFKQRAEAKSNYEQLLADYPQFDRAADALLNLARLESELGNQALAKNRHKEVLEKFPQTPQADEAAYWLALAATDEKDSEAAQWYVEAIFHDWDPAEKNLSERRQHLRAQVVCLKCQQAAIKGNWQEISDLATTTKWNNQSGLFAPRLAFWEAEAEFRLGNYQAARQKFEETHLLAVGNAEPWIPMVSLRRAQLAARQQQWKIVLEIVNEFELTYPEFELAYEVDYLRGRALAGLGRMSEARVAYQEILMNELADETETAAMAQWMIGETFFHQHDYKNAQAAYQKVFLDHQFSEWQAKAALQAGKCTELQGHWHEAVAYYEQALKTWRATEVAPQLAERLKWAQRQAALNISTLRK